MFEGLEASRYINNTPNQIAFINTTAFIMIN